MSNNKPMKPKIAQGASRQRNYLDNYERDVLHPAEEAGDECVLVDLKQLRWLWNLADKAPNPPHREKDEHDVEYDESIRGGRSSRPGPR